MHGERKGSAFCSLCCSADASTRIWEKKYGKNANHVKKEQAAAAEKGPQNRRGGRDANGPRDRSRKPFGKPQDNQGFRPQVYSANAAGPSRPFTQSRPPAGMSHRCYAVRIVCSLYIASSRSASAEEGGKAAASIMGGKAQTEREAESCSSCSPREEDSFRVVSCSILLALHALSCFVQVIQVY